MTTTLKHEDKIRLTYATACELIATSSYEQATKEGWGDEWMSAADHVHVAEYDVRCGIIDSLTDYDEENAA
jgi:hypothetical protein|tara:strand:+ start:1041 stop:1253 length:213 start_codon:yes stop_codon:yes gene_type:complete